MYMRVSELMKQLKCRNNKYMNSWIGRSTVLRKYFVSSVIVTTHHPGLVQYSFTCNTTRYKKKGDSGAKYQFINWFKIQFKVEHIGTRKIHVMSNGHGKEQSLPMITLVTK